MEIFRDIPLGESDNSKSSEQKELEHELICLMNSFKPDKERIKELKKKLKIIIKKK
jgi:hypothetical protein